MDIPRNRVITLGIMVFVISGIMAGSFAFADYCNDYELQVKKLLEKGWTVPEGERSAEPCR